MADKKIDFKYDLKVYLSLAKRYKFLFFSTIFFVLLMEASKLGISYLFKILVDKGTLYSQGLAPNFTQTLLYVGLAFGALAILRPIVFWVRFTLLNKLETKLMLDIKVKFYNHLIYLSHKFHSTNKTGSLISRMLRGSHAVEGMTDVIIFNFSPLVLQLILVASSLVAVYWVSGVVVFIMSIAFIAYSVFLQEKMKVKRMDFLNNEDREKALVADSFTNIDSIKYFGKEKPMTKKYFKLANKTLKSLLSVWNIFRWLSAGQIFIMGVGLFFMLFFPLKAFLSGTLTIGEIVFIYTLYRLISNPLYSFVHGLRNYYRAMTDFESLFRYGKIENEIKDKDDAKDFKVKKGIIEFNNVDFKYHDGNKYLFKKFNLKINKNEKVALVGHSGCGKSTLIKLLYRLYDLNSGSITIDGVDIRDVKQENLRNELSIVPQEGVLFDDTIWNNIKFTRMNATKKEVIDAMKFAQLYDIVQDFPKKELTIVGERGVKLSGGEKQRVSIARAILANKQILVLDEATSALDSQTEYNIQNDLEKLMKGRTSIIIAHRLSTIMKADKIIVMNKGKIVQMGIHAELIKQPGKYKQLWNLQKGGYL